jgi:hypothetical protein
MNSAQTKKSDNFISVPWDEFVGGRCFLYLAPLTGVDAIVEARGLVSTDATLDGHERVGRLLVRPVVQLSLFRVIGWGCRFHLDRTCALESSRRPLSHDRQSSESTFMPYFCLFRVEALWNMKNTGVKAGKRQPLSSSASHNTSEPHLQKYNRKGIKPEVLQTALHHDKPKLQETTHGL